MSDSITVRVGRIVSGGLNAIVDAMENASPEIVMEQVLREIDGAIDEVRAELGRASVAKHLANSRLMEENRRHKTLSEQIASAVAQDRDDLAEAGIAEQLDIEAQIPVLERAIAEAGDKEQELAGYIKALQAKKRELKAELQRFAESRRSAEGGGEQASGEGVAARVARAESAFDRVVERQTGLGGGKEGVDAGHAAKLAELEELARANRVKERLAALKSGPGGA